MAPMKNKRLLKIIIISASVFTLFYCTSQIFCLFFAGKTFRRVNPIYAPDSPYFQTDRKDNYETESPLEIFYQSEKDRCYPILKASSETVSIKSYDGLKLNAYLAKPENKDGKNSSHKYVLLMHGFRDSPKIISPYALHFYEKGFNILVPGQRGHGWSEGNLVDMSAFSPNDVKSWVEYITSCDSQAEIMLFGISMGAATVMRASALDLPSSVKACIEDCGFTSIWDEFAWQLKHLYHLPVHPLLDIYNHYTKRKLGFDLKKISALQAVTESKVPILFIHGSEDTFVPFYMQDKLYDAAACPKEKLVIEGAPHARSLFTNPLLYWDSIDAFAEKYF